MAVKRHELPPPGFFNHFHGRVMDRIADEFEKGKVAWWERALLLFDSKPVMAGTYALTASALFLCGLGFSQMIQTENAQIEIGGRSMVSASLMQPAAFAAEGFAAPVSSMNPVGMEIVAETSPQVGLIPDPSPGGPPSFLFAPAELRAQPVSYGPAGR